MTRIVNGLHMETVTFHLLALLWQNSVKISLKIVVNQHYYHHQEFWFTLADDVYIRYQSFNNQQEMEEEMKKMKSQKIDLGAVYNFR